MQVLTELENTLAHLSQYYNPELDCKQKQENITKSCDHLERVTLDLYKLLWVEMHRQLELFYLDENKRSFALNTSEEDFIKGFNAFRIQAQKARDVEIKKVGANPLLAIELYKESIVLGKELINNISPPASIRILAGEGTAAGCGVGVILRKKAGGIAKMWTIPGIIFHICKTNH